MADMHDRKTRSYNMSRIRSKNTKPELIVRKYLFSKGLRYRLHDKELPSKPDLAFRKYKTVVFVHGCFWHSHTNCKYAVEVKSNRKYWIPKIQSNVKRAANNEDKLRELGWRVIIVWECELKSDIVDKTLNSLYLEIIKT